MSFQHAHYFDIIGNMKTSDAINQLGALAQDTRLTIFRTLVQRHPEAVSAGELGQQLGVAAATLSFHLSHLERAGLIQHRRQGRQRLYQARLEAMNKLMAFLFEDCCQGNPAACPEGLMNQLRNC